MTNLEMNRKKKILLIMINSCNTTILTLWWAWWWVTCSNHFWVECLRKAEEAKGELKFRLHLCSNSNNNNPRNQRLKVKMIGKQRRKWMMMRNGMMLIQIKMNKMMKQKMINFLTMITSFWCPYLSKNIFAKLIVWV